MRGHLGWADKDSGRRPQPAAHSVGNGWAPPWEVCGRAQSRGEGGPGGEHGALALDRGEVQGRRRGGRRALLVQPERRVGRHVHHPRRAALLHARRCAAPRVGSAGAVRLARLRVSVRVYSSAGAVRARRKPGPASATPAAAIRASHGPPRCRAPMPPPPLTSPSTRKAPRDAVRPHPSGRLAREPRLARAPGFDPSASRESVNSYGRPGGPGLTYNLIFYNI